MLGNETLLFSKMGDSEFISRMQRPREIEADETMEFSLNFDRMHLFEAESGASLRPA
jgi:multiple sugar transport system ATP-binding protein